jgi:hypothetical protein
LFSRILGNISGNFGNVSLTGKVIKVEFSAQLKIQSALKKIQSAQFFRAENFQNPENLGTLKKS